MSSELHPNLPTATPPPSDEDVARQAAHLKDALATATDPNFKPEVLPPPPAELRPPPPAPAVLKKAAKKKPIKKLPLKEPLVRKAGEKSEVLDFAVASYLCYYGNGYNVRDAIRGMLEDSGILVKAKRKLKLTKKVNPNAVAARVSAR